jgi:hypothetical protein
MQVVPLIRRVLTSMFVVAQVIGHGAFTSGIVIAAISGGIGLIWSRLGAPTRRGLSAVIARHDDQ